MATLDATDSGLVGLACADTVVFYDLSTESSWCWRADFNTSSPSLSARFSTLGSMYAVGRGKRLTLLSVADRRVINSWQLAKSAARIAFPADDRVIVADKAGDVRVYPAAGDGGDLLLGHLSVLFDVLTTADLRHIITCDRDEKIRVSRYPDSYDIVGYCLGHEEFVSSIGLLPHDARTLVSCSGDGTLRFWHYTTCVQIAVVDCRRAHAGTSSGALTQCLPIALDSESSLLAVLCSEYTGILVYSVSGTGPTLKCDLVQAVRTSAHPRRLATTGGATLWALLKDDDGYLASYGWNKEAGVFERTAAGAQLMSAWAAYDVGRNLDRVFESETPIDALYKRKFDNVQEYLDKKTARLDGKTAKQAKKIKTEDRTRI